MPKEPRLNPAVFTDRFTSAQSTAQRVGLFFAGRAHPSVLPFMTSAIYGAVLLPVHDLRLGPMRLSPYGLCAAAGVVSAMGLAGRAARRSGLPSEAVWDTGLFAIACCFVFSRLLLVIQDPQAFLRFPLLVLSLPSLTVLGMALAAVAVWVYLRRKHLPMLRLLDAFSPAGALLASFLELGHWLDQSEIGMPLTRGGKVTGYQPVSLYGLLLALGIAAILWRFLRAKRPPGRVAALGLMLGGLGAFGLDLLTLPVDFIGTLPLEPGQMLALGAALAGALLWTFSPDAGGTQPVPNLPGEV